MERPYEPLHMTTLMWQAVPPVLVLIASLTFLQDVDDHWVKTKEPLRSECGDPFPFVVEYAGRLYVEDGAHRIRQRQGLGASRTVARVLREYTGC